MKQSQDVTAYEDMIRRLETELIAAEEQRKQTVSDFHNLKASLSSSDSAAKEHVAFLSSQVCNENRLAFFLLADTYLEDRRPLLLLRDACTS